MDQTYWRFFFCRSIKMYIIIKKQGLNLEFKSLLDDQYQQWQPKIDARHFNFGDDNTARRVEQNFEDRIENHRESLVLEKFSLPASVKQEINVLIDELEQFKEELEEKYVLFRRAYINWIRDYTNQLLEERRTRQQLENLTPERIQQFNKFQADESFVGDQCVICMGDVEIGRNMMRLDCDGQHTFCQVCIEGWFADHNTCPICRHKF